MKCYGISMVHSNLGLLSLLACVVWSRSVRYGDYAAHMSQYEERRGDAQDDEFVLGMEVYDDKSPDAPARLDYKYQEERHDKGDDGKIRDIDEAWDKPRKKTRNPLKSHSYHNINLDENSFDDIKSKNQENDEYFMRRSRFRNNDFETQSDKRLKHKLMERNEDQDNTEDKSYYIQKDNLDRVDRIDEFEDFNHIRHRFATQKKVRRKPRDRAQHPEKTRENKHLKLDEEELDALRNKDQYFGCTSPRGSVPITDLIKIRKPIKQAHDYDYGEFYDMKRIHSIKDRLPAVLRQKTVRTTWQQSIPYFENRKRFERRDASPIVTTSESDSAITTLSTTLKITLSLPTSLNASTTTPTNEHKLGSMNTSDLSLAEKSRLSILKKALKKESGRNVSTSTKPPVLMQVTRKMQTVVVVEPQPQAERRASIVAFESPERLQRARRLMRRKLVAAARSIHDLTENWDEMVCDYIDVSLLDADCATSIRLDFSVIRVSMFSLPFFLAFSWC